MGFTCPNDRWTILDSHYLRPTTYDNNSVSVRNVYLTIFSSCNFIVKTEYHNFQLHSIHASHELIAFIYPNKGGICDLKSLSDYYASCFNMCVHMHVWVNVHYHVFCASVQPYPCVHALNLNWRIILANCNIRTTIASIISSQISNSACNHT